jgi:TonB family protein
VSFYKRLDGTVITDNCPIGLRKLRAQYRKLAAAIATIVSLLQGLLLSVLAGEPAKSGSGCSSGTNTSEVQHTMGAPVPVQRLGGEPTAPVDPPAIKSYKNQVASVLAAAMPKGIDLGSAALSISIGTGGSVKSVQLISRSPSKETDEVILKVVQNLKFGNLPAEFYKHATPEGTLPVYFECRQAVAH